MSVPPLVSAVPPRARSLASSARCLAAGRGSLPARRRSPERGASLERCRRRLAAAATAAAAASHLGQKLMAPGEALHLPPAGSRRPEAWRGALGSERPREERPCTSGERSGAVAVPSLLPLCCLQNYVAEALPDSGRERWGSKGGESRRKPETAGECEKPPTRT